MEVRRYQTTEEAKKQTVSHLNLLLDAHSHIPILFLSSGGSSLELLQKVMVFPPHFTVGMTDERFSQDPKVNNFAQLAATSFFEKAQEKGAYFLDSRVQRGEDLDTFAKRLDNALKDWRAEHPGGRIVITQGVGPDCHTVGMMPFPEDPDLFAQLFDNEDQWVQGYDAGAKNEYPLRATITIPFLKSVDHAVTYMTGENKRKALERILADKGELAKTPCRILRALKEATIFTDIA